MSDIVAVALISAGSSLLGASVGALTTYKVSLSNSKTTIETAKGQHEVERARIEAENERLREQHSEEERRNRQSTYHQLIDSLFELFQLMGYAADGKEVDKACNRYRYLHAGVVLFAPASVRQGAFEVSEIYGEIWPAVTKERNEQPEKPDPERWRDATAGIKVKFGEEIVSLTALMHADVTRGVAVDPGNAA